MRMTEGTEPVVLAAPARAVAYSPVFGKIVEVAGGNIVHHVHDVTDPLVHLIDGLPTSANIPT